MDRTVNTEKGHLDPDHLEVVLDDTARGRATHYRPQTEEEKKLDRKVNFKLDCWVVTLLAIEFIVRGCPGCRRREPKLMAYSSVV